MKKLLLIIISIISLIPLSICQTSNKELPVSFLQNLPANFEEYNLKAQLTRVGNETRTEVIDGDTLDFSDPIIGELFSVPININNIGTWTLTENGDSIWRLQINSTAGNYMMLCFDDFYLPYGTKLFVYAADRSQKYGPFTDENNYPSRKFTTAPLKTNSLVIEYYKPFYIIEQAALNVKSVGLIGNNSKERYDGGFGASDPCMINVMCPEYESWCDQRRSVALQIRVFPDSDSTLRRGSGSLLSNEKRDGKPFYLTAFHCLDRNGNCEIDQSEKDELQYWVFVFNYQSPNCSNPIIEPTKEYFISGAIFLRGRYYYYNDQNTGSDYALLQLNKKPPTNYNVYYNGWSNKNEDVSDTCIGIHHPFKDIKKIAVWKKTGSTVNGWKGTYTEGGTQNGSSGSPLFNSSGYVVGQLMGGNKIYLCGKKSVGNYGRFDKSWHNHGLHYELNPSGMISGGNGPNINSWWGDETCKLNWVFNNCNDLHTSENVGVEIWESKRQYDGVYNAKNKITAENTIIQSGSNKKVVFEAGNSVVLKPGFHAVTGSFFTAKIGDCEMGCNNGKYLSNSNPNNVINNLVNGTTNAYMNNTLKEISNIQEFVIYPNPNHGVFSIKLHDDKSELQKVIVSDVRGIIVYNNIDENIVGNIIQLEKPTAGIYIIYLFFKDKILTSKFAVL